MDIIPSWMVSGRFGCIVGGVSSPCSQVIATFKSGKIINLHTEYVAASNLELRISHRFGRLDGGAYELGIG